MSLPHVHAEAAGVSAVKMAVALDTTWVKPDPEWNGGAGLVVYKTGNVVVMRGMVRLKKENASGGIIPLGNIPAEYRPNKSCVLGGMSGSGPGIFYIRDTGLLQFDWMPKVKVPNNQFIVASAANWLV